MFPFYYKQTVNRKFFQPEELTPPLSLKLRRASDSRPACRQAGSLTPDSLLTPDSRYISSPNPCKQEFPIQDLQLVIPGLYLPGHLPVNCRYQPRFLSFHLPHPLLLSHQDEEDSILRIHPT